MNVTIKEIALEPADNKRLLNLCGPFDSNIKQLERRLGIEINRRDNKFKRVEKGLCIEAAANILQRLYVDTAPVRGMEGDIDPEQVHLAIKKSGVLEQSAESVSDFGKAINIRTKRGIIKPRPPIRRSISPTSSIMILPSVWVLREREKPIWQSRRRWMRSSVRISAAFY